MNRLIEAVLKHRGYTQEYLYSIEQSNYDDLKDIDNLCVKLKKIHDSGTVLTIFPDIDTDGQCSGVLGLAGLAELGFNVGLYVPDSTNGYGITAESIDDLLEKYPNTGAIITCDVGITAYEAADRCKERHIQFLVTDHHMQKQKIDADCVVNPMRLDETYSHPAICGAFVLYQVLHRYAELYCSSFELSQIERLRVFAGIGTISDTMPVLYENRSLIRDAIAICQWVYGDGTSEAVSRIEGCPFYKMAFFGLFHYIDVFVASGVIASGEEIDEDFFGFSLAPTMNSPKRLEYDMSVAFRVFFGADAVQCAKQMYDYNEERKRVVVEEMEKIDNTPQPYAPYIYFSDAKSGIVGLLAMNILNRTGKPAFVLRDEGMSFTGPNRYHGSGRSPAWYNCGESLKNVMTMEGHSGAFGCGIANATDLKSVMKILDVEVPPLYDQNSTVEPDADFTISTDLNGDTGIDIALFDEYLRELPNLRPFGRDFPAPLIKLTFHDYESNWMSLKNGRHLKIELPMNFGILCWNQGHLFRQGDAFHDFTVYGRLDTSTFKGETSIVFIGDLVEQ